MFGEALHFVFRTHPNDKMSTLQEEGELLVNAGSLTAEPL